MFYGGYNMIGKMRIRCKYMSLRDLPTGSSDVKGLRVLPARRDLLYYESLF